MRTINNTVTAVASIFGLLCLGALTLAGSGENKSKSFRLHILHTNDIHSSFAEFNSEGTHCQTDEICFGGFPRLKTAIQNEIEKTETDANVGSLVLNAGDTFQGTMFFLMFKWPMVAGMISHIKIDAMADHSFLSCVNSFEPIGCGNGPKGDVLTALYYIDSRLNGTIPRWNVCLGNHEFDGGVSPVNSFVEKIQNHTNIVVCNIDMSNEPGLVDAQKIITKSKVLNVKGRKIGIIGYLTPDTAKLSVVGKLIFKDEVLSIREEARRLKDEGVKIIIALGHSGLEMDKKIAREVEEVDVVVGGHSHTFLYNGTGTNIDRAAGPYPICEIQPNTQKQVPVVQAFQATKYLGNLWVDFNEEGKVLNSFGNPILLDNSIDQEPELLKIIQNYERKIDESMKTVIGHTNVLLEGFGHFCRLRECNFGNFLTDAYVTYNAEENKSDFDPNLYWTDAPIAIQHGGSIRQDINHLLNSGDITYGQLISAIPFVNFMGKVSMIGSDIQIMLETAFMNYDGISHRGEFLQVSGLKITVDLSKNSGDHVKSIEVKSTLKDRKEDYELLNKNKPYKVIMSEYLFDGGDGYKFDKTRLKFTQIGKTNIDIVLKEFEKHHEISPKVENRIVFINANDILNDPVPSSSQKPNEYFSPGCGIDPKIIEL